MAESSSSNQVQTPDDDDDDVVDDVNSVGSAGDCWQLSHTILQIN